MGYVPSDPFQQENPMFKELAPYLRQRAVLLTVTHIEDDQIRVNVIPQKLKDGENAALTTPVTVTGTAEELDRDLPATLVNFVSAHLELKNTLDRAKSEMDAAAKTAQTEARAKSKTPAAKVAPKPEPAKAPETLKPTPQKPAEPARAASLFDVPAQEAVPALVPDEEEEIPPQTDEGNLDSDED